MGPLVVANLAALNCANPLQAVRQRGVPGLDNPRAEGDPPNDQLGSHFLSSDVVLSIRCKDS